MNFADPHVTGLARSTSASALEIVFSAQRLPHNYALMQVA
jgi:hypothetical protein